MIILQLVYVLHFTPLISYWWTLSFARIKDGKPTQFCAKSAQFTVY